MIRSFGKVESEGDFGNMEKNSEVRVSKLCYLVGCLELDVRRA